MKRFLRPPSRSGLSAFLLALAGSLAWVACSEAPDRTPTAPEAALPPQVASLVQEVGPAMRAQAAHGARLMATHGVVGHGAGVDANGEAVVVVYLAEPGVRGVPQRLDGVRVKPEVTGLFMAGADETSRSRPAPIGFSVGHFNITAGTIGARVTDGTRVLLLSNNHVLANSNDAAIGDATLQPGPYDGGTSADQIGTLYAFKPIDFDGGNNDIDAAVSLVNAADLSGVTPADEGYGAPGTTVATATVGMDVQKYGRTTGHTHGDVAEINATVNVCYESRGPFRCVRLARFVGQFTITPGSFSDGGDSGSLIVTDDGQKRPVGLLFAGSASRTIANPISAVLSYFGVTIDPTDPGGGGGGGGGGDDGGSGGGFTLTATGTKVRGLQKADLEWSGATSTNVDIYRDGPLLATTENDGSHRDNIDNRGGGSYTYQVCEAGTSTCSNEATVTF